MFAFGEAKSPLDALQKLYLICYCIAPHLIEKCNLETLARAFDSTKQCFSKRLLKLNKELGLRGRNQKSDNIRKTYAARTKAWHKAKEAEKKALKKAGGKSALL